MSENVSQETLENRIKDQFPSVFITLISVLIGLVKTVPAIGRP